MLVAQLLETIEQDLASGSQDSFRADSFLGNSATRFEAISTLDEIREAPAWAATGPSNLAGVNLDNISLAPVDEDEDASDKKNAKAKPSAKTTATVEAAVEPKKPQKVEVSPLLRKLAEQAAIQDEDDDESNYIFDSRSATLNQWKRRNYWENFPWRPIIFTMSLILAVVVAGIAIYTFFPSEWLGGAEQESVQS